MRDFFFESLYFEGQNAFLLCTSQPVSQPVSKHRHCDTTELVKNIPGTFIWSGVSQQRALCPQKAMLTGTYCALYLCLSITKSEKINRLLYLCATCVFYIICIQTGVDIYISQIIYYMFAQLTITINLGCRNRKIPTNICFVGTL